MTSIIEQLPSEDLDYIIDWTARGLGTDTIATSAFDKSSDDFDITSPSIIATNTKTQFWVSGGVPGTTYYITNTIVTVGGRTMVETIPFLCISQRII